MSSTKRDRLKTTLVLLFMISYFPLSAGTNTQFSRSLNNINTQLGSNAYSKTNQIQTYVESNAGTDESANIIGFINSVDSALPSLKTGNTFQIVSGTLSLIAATSSFIPKVGPGANIVFSLLSMIFGNIGSSSEEDMGSIVRREINNALNTYEDSELRAEAHGAARVYSVSHAFLKHKENSNIQRHETAALSANVPVYSGIRFLGFLSQKIHQNALSKERVQCRRAIEYTNLYVKLAILRSSLLWKLYSVVRSANHSEWTAGSIKNVIHSEEANDKYFLRFLVNPVYSRAVFHAMFHPSDWPIITIVLSVHGLHMHRFYPPSNTRFRPQRWTDWKMVMDHRSRMRGEHVDHYKHDSSFYLEPVWEMDNIFYIRSNRWPEWYMFMGGNDEGYCYGKRGRPGSEGQWKFVRYPDGKYLISPVKWPNWIIYMEDEDEGYIRGWVGDPGDQGHWLID